MASKEEVRRVSIYINGDPADLTLKQLTAGTSKLYNELSRLTVGTDAYNKKMTQLGEARKVLADVKDDINKVSQAMSKTGFFDDWKKGFAEIEEMAGKITIGTLIYKGISAAMEGVKELITGSIQAYEESVKTQTQLQQVLRTTGGVAGETREQLEKYQKSLMDQTGIDDDVIAKGEEMLLTFTNIRGKIYDQALPAIIDMTAALNGGKVTMEGIQATSIQVGKALNDPINGMTALKKVGVTLDETQKQQIKTFQESNRMMDAQAVILKELQKEFGGTAKAIADTDDVGRAQKFETRIGNIKESIGKFLVEMKNARESALEPFAATLEKITTTPVSEALRDEQEELNSLVGAIVSCNDNQAVRNHLIEELQQKYPDFIGNIKAEKVTNELLVEQLKAINDQYREKIFIAANEEKIKDIQERRNRAIKEEADARERVAKATGLSAEQLARLNDEQFKNVALQYTAKTAAENRLGKSLAGAGSAPGHVQDSQQNIQADHDIQLILNGRKKIEDSFKEESDLEAANAVYQDKLTKMKLANIDKEIAAIKKRMATEKEADRELDEIQLKRLEQERKGILGIVDKPQSGPSAASQEAAKREAEAALKAFQDLAREKGQFDAAELAGEQAKNEKEVQLLEKKYDDFILKEKEFLKKKGVTAAQRKATDDAITNLEVEKAVAVTTLRARQAKELTDKLNAFEEKITGKLETELDKQLREINAFYDNLEKDAGDDPEAKAKIEASRARAITDAKLTEEERFIADKKKIDEEGVVDDADKDKLELARINKKYDDEIAALKLKYNKEIKATKAFQDAIDQIEHNRKAEIDQKDADGKKARLKEELNFAIESTKEIANAEFRISENKRNTELNSKISQLEKQKDAELSNANLTQAQKDAINQKYAKQEAELKLKAWKADQKAKETQAIINGALAITQTFAQMGWPAGIIGAAAVAIETGIEVAEIGAQDPPEFAQGGYSNVDYSKPQGYVKRPTLFAKSDSGRPFIAGEGNRTEYIVSSKQLQDPAIANFVGMIEANRKVRMFEMGGFTSSVSNGNKMPVSNNSNTSSTGGSLHETNQLLRELTGHFQDFKDKPWDFNMRAFKIYQNKIDQTQSNGNA